MNNIWKLLNELVQYLLLQPEIPARAALTSGTETTVIPLRGGKKIIAVGLSGTNQDAALTTRVDFRDGTGGTIIYSFVMSPNGGGFTHQPFRGWKLTVGNNLTAQLSVAVNAFVTVEYFVVE